MGAETPSLAELILSGDQDAVAGYYDGRSPSVFAYCAEVSARDEVEGAVLAAFADFLGRIRAAGTDADPDDLLRKSTRTAAASRMRVTHLHDPACRSMPELIAARANGELPHGEEPINAHLELCRSCRQVAQRLVDAEDVLAGSASRQPPEELRAAWLLIASREAEAAPAPQAPEPQPEAAAASEAWLPPQAGDPQPATEPDPAPEAWLPPQAADPQPATEPDPAPEPEPEPPPVQPEPMSPPVQPEPIPVPKPEPPDIAAQEPTPPPSQEPIHRRRRSGGLIDAARRVASSRRR